MYKIKEVEKNIWIVTHVYFISNKKINTYIYVSWKSLEKMTNPAAISTTSVQTMLSKY